MIQFNKIDTVIFICRHRNTLYHVPYRNKLTYLRSLVKLKSVDNKRHESYLNSMLVYNYPMFLMNHL